MPWAGQAWDWPVGLRRGWEASGAELPVAHYPRSADSWVGEIICDCCFKPLRFGVFYYIAILQIQQIRPTTVVIMLILTWIDLVCLPTGKLRRPSAHTAATGLSRRFVQSFSRELLCTCCIPCTVPGTPKDKERRKRTSSYWVSIGFQRLCQPLCAFSYFVLRAPLWGIWYFYRGQDWGSERLTMCPKPHSQEEVEQAKSLDYLASNIILFSMVSSHLPRTGY